MNLDNIQAFNLVLDCIKNVDTLDCLKNYQEPNFFRQVAAIQGFGAIHTQKYSY